MELGLNFFFCSLSLSLCLYIYIYVYTHLDSYMSVHGDMICFLGAEFQHGTVTGLFGKETPALRKHASS